MKFTGRALVFSVSKSQAIEFCCYTRMPRNPHYLLTVGALAVHVFGNVKENVSIDPEHRNQAVRSDVSCALLLLLLLLVVVVVVAVVVFSHLCVPFTDVSFPL